MNISRKDVVKPQVGIKGQTQAADTTNKTSIGGFLPLVAGGNRVFFADVLANANFVDFNKDSSSSTLPLLAPPSPRHPGMTKAAIGGWSHWWQAKSLRARGSGGKPTVI